MPHRISCFFAFFLVVIYTECELTTVSVSGQKVSIYRVKTNHSFELFRNNESNVVADIKDIILGLPFEIERLADITGFTKDFLPLNNSERDLTDMCHENNGNCSQICETVSGKAVCSCREGFSITDNGECTEVSYNSFVLSGTSGNFTIDEYNKDFIIKAPENHIIKCVLTVVSENQQYYDNSFNLLYVYYEEVNPHDIPGNKHSFLTREWITTGPYLKIRQSYSHYGPLTFHGIYQTGALTLSPDPDEYANIQIPLALCDECYSISFFLPKEEDICYNWYSAQLQMQEKRESISSSLRVKNSQWETHIFGLPVNSEYESLTLDFKDSDVKVFSLRKCFNIEKYAISGPMDNELETKCLNGGTWDSEKEICFCPYGFSGQYCEEEREKKCFNGGSWDTMGEFCRCPMGFVGDYCEEGCGPNRYGENCTEVCSKLSSQCEGIIFCTEQMCSCAPGWQGINCNKPCSQRWYGSSCQRMCGKCKDDKPCDTYTGICYSGCATGFYPPLCQQTYKVLQDTPYVAEVGYTYAALRILFQNITGGGDPAFYEVQYRVTNSQDVQGKSWEKLAPRIISDDTKFNLTGLLPGKKYAVRIILIDKDGGRYETDVPEITVMTKCIERQHANYHFGVRNVSAYALDFEWAHTKEENSLICEIVKFELSFVAGEENFTIPVTEFEGINRMTYLLPETEYSFQLIGETVTGQRIIPPKQTVRTLPAAPGKVRNVRVVSADVGTTLLVSWQRPWNSAETQLIYKVTYECEKIFACGNISCPSSGYVDVQTNSILLDDLNPHALYEIKVAAISSAGETGEEYTIRATTAHTAPRIKPSAAENPILSVTNTTVSLKWMPPTDCTQINGYLNGYSYKLIDKETKYALYEGSVPDYVLHTSFSDLIPRHCYEALLAVAATGGTDFRNVLVIPFCTTSTAPDQVQALEVYKRGRRMVGLRWGLPLELYGGIKSFTITYSKVGKTATKTMVVEPVNCKAWPNLYCHTITNLSPGKKYKFVVQARNTEVNIDGAPVSVETITMEGASTPPRNLRVINATETNVLLAWDIPENINGQLRSFIVLAEQIDINGNSDECCDEIPLQDYRVTSEEPFYTYEITGLKPATTYSVAVAAKTLNVGEQALKTVHTFPPKPSLPENALTLVENERSISESDTVSLRIHPAASIAGVNRTYIVLLLTKWTLSQEELEDPSVESLLQSEFGKDYHIVSEYTEEEIEKEPVIKFRTRDQSVDSEDVQPQKYALVLIQDYMGLKSMNVFVTNDN